MIIFLYGPDSFRSKQKLDEIVAQYKSLKKSGLSLLRIDAAQTDFAEFFHGLASASMFAETKLAIAKNLFSAKAFQEKFLEEMESLVALKDVIVVYETEVDQRLKIFKQLVKLAKCQEFAALEPKQVKAWIVQQCQVLGTKMNVDAMELLANYAGNDLWRLSEELKKLAFFKQGSVIRKDDVELQVKPKLEVDIFKTMDALAQKNKPQALALLQKHVDGGEAPLYLLSMMAWQFKNLLVVKELAQKGLMYNSIVAKSGLHPFVVKKNYYMCSQFSFEELKRIYQRIFDIDAQIKTGRVEPEIALDLFVSSI